MAWIIYGLVALVALVLVGGALLLVWCVWMWLGSSYRRWRRGHLYQPVLAKVTRVVGDWLPGHRGMALVWVSYQGNGQAIQNRLAMSGKRARQARLSGAIEILVDPNRPMDYLLKRA